MTPFCRCLRTTVATQQVALLPGTSAALPLVAQPKVDAPALDILAKLYVATTVAEPARFADHHHRTEADLLIGSNAGCGSREHGFVEGDICGGADRLS